jgi:NADH:ubiquinone oxidoreductase subunit K
MYLQPTQIFSLTGAESAVALALLVSFYPTYVNIGIMLMAAKLIGAGLATIALAGAAVGVGLIFVIFNLVNIKAGMALLFDLV